jgi:uncharacterized protein (TIGR03086 family)
MTQTTQTETAEAPGPFTISTDLPVSPDEAFALITQPERLRRWKAVSATVDLRAGGEYRFTILPGHIAGGRFREIEPGRRLVFGWGWEDDPTLPPDTSTVTVTIEPIDTGCRVTLVHEGLDAEQAARHGAGWTHFFERLDRLTATGDAGPDEWVAVPDRLDPMTAAEACLAVIQPMLRNLTPEDQPRPTPCDGLTCHDMAEHLMASLAQVGGMAGAEVTRPETGGLETKVSEMAAQAIDGWRARGTEGGIAQADGSEFPAFAAASLLAVELLLHGWDLAEGSGQRLVVSEPLVAYVREIAEPVVAGGRGRAFRDEVEPRADADAVERLAAYAGRSPLR